MRLSYIDVPVRVPSNGSDVKSRRINIPIGDLADVVGDTVSGVLFNVSTGGHLSVVLHRNSVNYYGCKGQKLPLSWNYTKSRAKKPDGTFLLRIPITMQKKISTVRPDRDEYFLQMAELVATRSTCMRRSVGAVAVNERGHVMATGYNGVPTGMPHCNEIGGTCCQGATSPSGADLDGCMAVHAEVNLLAQCHDVWKIHTVYATVSPCFSCVKALMSSSCRRLMFRAEYPHPAAKTMWIGSGREWMEMPRG